MSSLNVEVEQLLEENVDFGEAHEGLHGLIMLVAFTYPLESHQLVRNVGMKV